MKKLVTLLFMNVLVAFTSLSAENPAIKEGLLDIQHKWAIVNYQLTDDEQEEGFEWLIHQIDKLTKDDPQKAEFWIWKGIIQSSFAGAKGGLGGLSLAKSAKKSLEKAIVIDGKILHGSAYTSLAVMYHKVPGWPLGFGDDDEAKKMFEMAISLNPNGIDPNYFYAEFLFDENYYDQSKKHLELAMNAPAREHRKFADASRKVEIQALLMKVNKKIMKSGKKKPK